ncbi:MAG: DivIVA domain-containing protein [Actinobacteria bacterium]|nr:MAG: DivIVA domain-containing protein [Actinomycetota bacterium]TMK94047.1 MAG: DivIVA domain-containing protein [Actinomycetota bacterium]
MTQGSADEVRPAAGATITPLDIQQKEFRVSRFGGYRMRDVDEFLDRLTEVVTALTEENARLRRQVGAAPVVGSPDLDDVARQADEIIQRARDEAARIDTEARARASLSTAPAVASEGDRAAVKAFLAQERAFLESLAGLLQGHAETMKGMARNVRRPDRASPEDSDAPAASTEPVAHEESPPAAVTSGEPDEGPIVEVGDAEETQSLPAAEEPGELAQTRPTTSARGSDRGDGDPSLRELFWGEEE